MQPIRKNDSSLSELLRHFMRQDKMKPALYQKKIEQAWTEMMGKTINRNTVSLTIRNQVLRIRVKSASLKQELHFAKPEMLRKFNEILGEEYLKEINITS